MLSAELLYVPTSIPYSISKNCGENRKKPSFVLNNCSKSLVPRSYLIDPITNIFTKFPQTLKKRLSVNERTGCDVAVAGWRATARLRDGATTDSNFGQESDSHVLHSRISYCRRNGHINNRYLPGACWVWVMQRCGPWEWPVFVSVYRAPHLTVYTTKLTRSAKLRIKVHRYLSWGHTNS